MSVGVNKVWLAGEVSEEVRSASTGKGTLSITFPLAVLHQARNRQLRTRIKINAYGGVARVALDRLSVGMYVLVVGELMNRPGRVGSLLEVRACEIVFPEARS